MNADLIAGGLSPFSPESAAILAGRLMLERIKNLANQRKDFGFETTLSGFWAIYDNSAEVPRMVAFEKNIDRDSLP